MNNPNELSFLVVNADDLGLSKSSTAGVIEAHLNGVVTSASLVVTTSAGEFAAEEVRKKCPQLGTGLHFTLSAGNPVAEISTVILLADQTGNFQWGFLKLLWELVACCNVRLLQQIEIELRAQIKKMRSFGLGIDHLNSERHVHMIPPLFKVMVRVAKEENIPYVRLVNDAGMKWGFALPFSVLFFRGGILKYLLFKFLCIWDKKHIDPRVAVTNGYATLLATGRMDRTLKAIFKNPGEGVVEVGVHPGLPTEFPEDDSLPNELRKYLKSRDRQAELEGCRLARNYQTTAKLVRFRDLVLKVKP